MTLVQQVDALQAQTTELRKSLDSSQNEAKERIRSRADEADRAEDAVAPAGETSDAKQSGSETGNGQKSRWQQMKADAAARRQEAQSRIDRKHEEHGVKHAQHEAEMAEVDARDALDFASWAIDAAGVAVFDAIEARAEADSRSAGATAT